MNNILLINENDLELIRNWPLELRAIFDPVADLELAQRIAEEPESDDDAWTDDPPF